MMRTGLDSINTLNRTYRPFTIAGVEPYVQFFDKHGTPNDRVLAYYLLGRAYYDHGEAPMALQCYQQAIEHSDTTLNDCDYAQLSRVYAQMSEIYYDQGLYREGLYHDRMSERTAWLGADTLAALLCYEQEGYAYFTLEQMDSFVYVTKEAAQKY